MADLRDVFTNNLKYYRKLKKISQEELSCLIGKGSTYENKGSWPSPEMIDKIASALEIRSAILFDESQCPANLVMINTENFVADISETIHKKIKLDILKTLKEIIG